MTSRLRPRNAAKSSRSPHDEGIGPTLAKWVQETGLPPVKWSSLRACPVRS